jgi:hypothetical protein
LGAEVARFAGFTALVTSHLGLALRTVRSPGSETRYPPVVWFIIAMTVLVLVAAATIPAFRTILHFERMSFGVWVSSLVIGAVVGVWLAPGLARWSRRFRASAATRAQVATAKSA